MIRGAIFDLDGVLLDSLGIWYDLGMRYILGMGMEPVPGMSETLFSMSMEQGAEYLKRTFSLEKSEEEIIGDLEQILRDYYYKEVSAKEGAEQLLAFLQKQGVKMAVATSSLRPHVMEALKRLGLFFYVQEIITTSEVGESKHSPRIYELAAHSLGFPAEEILVFEDSLYALKTAKAAGFRCVGVYDAQGESDQRGLKTTADLYLQSLLDFLENWHELACEQSGSLKIM